MASSQLSSIGLLSSMASTQVSSAASLSLLTQSQWMICNSNLQIINLGSPIVNHVVWPGPLVLQPRAVYGLFWGKRDGNIDRSELMSLLRAWGDFMKQKEVVWASKSASTWVCAEIGQTQNCMVSWDIQTCRNQWFFWPELIGTDGWLDGERQGQFS